MEYTEQQRQEFRSQFAVRRRRQLLALIPVIAALAILVVSEDRSEPLFGLAASTWGPLGFGVVVLVLLFSIYNWRCPACKKYLGRGFAPRFCARCGVELAGGS